MGKIITAIDIGTTKIVAIVGELTENNKIKIISKGIVPTPQKSVKKGVVQNIGIVSNAIRKAVEIAEEKSDVKFKSSFIGIAGQHIKSIQNSHSMPILSRDNIITEEDVDKIMHEIKAMAFEETKEVIDVIPQSYTVDYESDIDEPVGRFGNKLTGNFHVIIGDTSGTKNIKRCVEHANIEVNELFLEPIASASAVLTEDEKDGGVALVDIGGGTTDLAIFYEGVLRHTAVIPFGGDIITNDIKVAYNILHKYAEKLKIECGTALSEFADKNTLAVIPGISGRPPKEIAVDELAKVIQARMEEVIDIINYEIENSGYRNKLAAGISLTGGGSLLKYLPQLMKYRTFGLEVKLSKPLTSIFDDKKNEIDAKLSTAFGLVQLGLLNDDKTKSINIKKKKAEKQKTEKSKTGNGLKKLLTNVVEITRQGTINFFDDNDTEI